MIEAQTIVIGAGIVGLAVARELELAGQEVFVLERASKIGTETSSRNSEAIHIRDQPPCSQLIDPIAESGCIPPLLS